MNVWRLITHHADKDAALFWSRQNSRIAIGWGAIGDIRNRYNSADAITSAIRTAYPGLDNSHLGGSSLWDFYAQIQIGDFVILSAGRPRVLVVAVDGDYEWTSESPFEGDYQHQRCVIVRRDLSPEDIWRKAGRSARVRTLIVRSFDLSIRSTKKISRDPSPAGTTENSPAIYRWVRW